MSARDLTDEQIERAYALWREGRTLGEIARELECDVMDLSPWLYTAEMKMGDDGSR